MPTIIQTIPGAYINTAAIVSVTRGDDEDVLTATLTSDAIETLTGNRDMPALTNDIAATGDPDKAEAEQFDACAATRIQPMGIPDNDDAARTARGGEGEQTDTTTQPRQSASPNPVAAHPVDGTTMFAVVQDDGTPAVAYPEVSFSLHGHTFVIGCQVVPIGGAEGTGHRCLVAPKDLRAKSKDCVVAVEKVVTGKAGRARAVFQLKPPSGLVIRPGLVPELLRVASAYITPAQRENLELVVKGGR